MGRAGHFRFVACLGLILALPAQSEETLRVEYGKVKEVFMEQDYSVLFMNEVDLSPEGRKEPVVAEHVALEKMDEPNTVFKDKDKNHVVFNLRDLKALLNGKFIRIVTQFEVREDPVEPGSEAKIMIYKAKMIEFSKDLKRLIKK
ncbi:MAG: hypothetical protein ABSH53_12295 [Holophaga sp.]|jgi:hypothetical protein